MMTKKRMTLEEFKGELEKLRAPAKALVRRAPTRSTADDAGRIVFAIDHAKDMLTYEMLEKTI